MHWLLWMAIVAAVLGGGTIYYLGTGQRSVTAALQIIHYDEAVAAVDRLYQEVPQQSGVTLLRSSPAPLVGVAPKVRLTEEGAYLRTHSSFVEEDGVFILRSGTRFDPAKSSDPHFKRVRDRLFRYHISG